jgi:hypothetical protein
MFRKLSSNERVFPKTLLAFTIFLVFFNFLMGILDLAEKPPRLGSGAFGLVVGLLCLGNVFLLKDYWWELLKNFSKTFKKVTPEEREKYRDVRDL